VAHQTGELPVSVARFAPPQWPALARPNWHSRRSALKVGTALLDYLQRGRPTSACRHVFLRVEFPLGPLGQGAVGAAFHTWARRAGTVLPARGGPHCLRHALALHLLRQGSALKTIGDILGHRSAESTGVYLRLNVDDLRDVALPLPASAGVKEVRP
jgi:integrase/recombinase XerD